MRTSARRETSVLAGSALLFGLIILSTALGLAEASGALAPETYMAVFGLISWVKILGELAGMALLLVGFGLGLPAVRTVPVGGEASLTLANKPRLHARTRPPHSLIGSRAD
ncbi:MAG: hypothetical protein ABSG37_14440 [Candidatus Limnocylindrales bacterium]